MSFEPVERLGYELEHYRGDLAAGDAVRRYLARAGLGDGGYHADWVKVVFGRIPVWLPNGPSRKRAIRSHDLHHVATGCNGRWNQGELDVVAYELRSGGGGLVPLTWIITLNLFTLGLLLRPGPLYRCWVQSGGTRNLFGTRDHTHLYAMSVEALRRHLGFTRTRRRAGWRDRLSFAGCALLALTATALSYGPVVLLLAWLVA